MRGLSHPRRGRAVLVVCALALAGTVGAASASTRVSGHASTKAEVVFVCVDTPPTASGDAETRDSVAERERLLGRKHLEPDPFKRTFDQVTGAAANRTSNDSRKYFAALRPR